MHFSVLMTPNNSLGRTREEGEEKEFPLIVPEMQLMSCQRAFIPHDIHSCAESLKLQLTGRRNGFHFKSPVPDSWTRHSAVNEALCSKASAALKWILLWPNKNHRLEIVMIQKFSARNRGSCKIFGNCRKRLMVSLCQGEESWPFLFMVPVPCEH